MEKITYIFRHFLPEADLIKMESLSGGVIHQTYKMTASEKGEQSFYILQCMNTETFKAPEEVMNNTLLVQQFLISQTYPLALSIPLPAKDGKTLYIDESGEYWRFFKFIPDSKTFEKATDSRQLHAAGKAYGTFITYLKDFDAQHLAVTIPDFHHIKNRYDTFVSHYEHASAERKEKATSEIVKTQQFYHQFQSIDFSKLPIRTTHNDCKLSNLLFDANTGACIAVIDLDTVMPGYIPTDFGDMVRTMCNAATEDETDLTKVNFDLESFQSLYQGFLTVTDDWLTPPEKDNLVNGAIYIILEQAIRFLSDYLNEDQYYVVKYPEHNLDRTKNQLHLLDSMITHPSLKLLTSKPLAPDS